MKSMVGTGWCSLNMAVKIMPRINSTLTREARIRPRKHQSVDRLRGAVWLSHVLALSGLTVQAFAKEHLYSSRTKSGLVEKWLRGDVSPCRQTALRVERTLPGALDTFDHPIFELLKNVRIPDSRVWRLLSALPSVKAVTKGRASVKVADRRHLSEILPEKSRARSRPLSTPMWMRPDSWQLKCQPSLDSLTKMIGLLRVVEDPRYVDKHATWAQDVFRLMPPSLQEPWLAPHLDAFVDQLDVIRGRVPGSTIESFSVDRSAMKEQLGWKNFRPLYLPGDKKFDLIRVRRSTPEHVSLLKPDMSYVVDLMVI